MEVYMGYKCRIYPNKTQEIHIKKSFGCSRFIYNRFLQLKTEMWEEEEKSIGRFEMGKMVTQLKKEPDFSWLSEVNASVLHNAVQDLDNGFKAFFRRVKRGEKPGYPKFKSRGQKQSFRISNVNNPSGPLIYLKEGKIRLPKMGYIKQRGLQSFDGEIMSVTISQTPTGKYYASLLVREKLEVKSNNGNHIGLALNIDNIYTDSNGRTVQMPEPIKKYKEKEKFYAREFSRKEKGSHGYEYARKKLAKGYELRSNVMNDLLHKESRKLVEENEFIAICEYPIMEMMREKSKDASRLQNISWYKFITLLEYKAYQHGSIVKVLPKDYMYIQICPNCGHEDNSKKDLKLKEWICPQCGAVSEFHKNMAESILKKAEIMLKEQEETKSKEAKNEKEEM